MSVNSRLHFGRITLRRRLILIRLMLCGNGGFRAKLLKKSGVFGAMEKTAGMSRINCLANRS